MKILSISTYGSSAPARELPTGPSMTVPGRALSIGEICRRSVIGANLPNLAFTSPLDQGSDEDFDDAFDNDFDIIDSKESKENFGYLLDRYSEQERAKSKLNVERVTEEQVASTSGTLADAKPKSEENLFE